MKTSRRTFLVTATAAVGSEALFGRSSACQDRPAWSARKTDVHYHILAPIALRSKNRLPAVEPWDPVRSLLEMNSCGVGRTILSMPTNAVWSEDLAERRRFVRECNEYAARVAGDHAGRFGFFASVPLPDLYGALEETRYAIEVLRADGIHLATSYGVRWIGDPSFTAMLRIIDSFASVASIHPPGAHCCRQLSSYLHPANASKESARAAASLRNNPAVTSLRKVRYLFPHLVTPAAYAAQARSETT